MPAAGGKDQRNFAGNKGIAVQGERSANMKQQANRNTSYIDNTELVARVRERIKSRGARGILNLGKSFKIMDDNNSGSLDSEEFAKALKSYRITDQPLEI